MQTKKWGKHCKITEELLHRELMCTELKMVSQPGFLHQNQQLARLTAAWKTKHLELQQAILHRTVKRGENERVHPGVRFPSQLIYLRILQSHLSSKWRQKPDINGFLCFAFLSSGKEVQVTLVFLSVPDYRTVSRVFK